MFRKNSPFDVYFMNGILPFLVIGISWFITIKYDGLKSKSVLFINFLIMTIFFVRAIFYYLQAKKDVEEEERRNRR